MVRVVFHVMAKNNAYYDRGGLLNKELQEKSGVEIDFVSFSGLYLSGNVLEKFIGECKNADVVIIDAWNHPKTNPSKWTEDPHGSTAFIAQRIVHVNPIVELFAQLMEGTYKVAVHEIAEPFKLFCQDNIIRAIKNSI